MEKNGFMKVAAKALLYTFSLVGVLCIMLLMMVSRLLMPQMETRAVVGENSVLLIDFNRSFPEIGHQDIISEISGGTPISLYELLGAIETAQNDKNISALFAQIDDTDLGAAQVQEVRNAIKKFRESGKKAYVYSQGFGSFGGGFSEYYLASAFDEIWMQPKSMIGITGISVEVPFARGLLQKIGIEPEIYARYEYKSAAASFTDYTMSPVYRKEMQSLVNDFGNTVVDQITQDRSIDAKSVRKYVDLAPLFAEDGLDKKLIDRIGYKAELFAEMRNPQVISVYDYAKNVYEQKLKNEVALVFLEGVINSGESAENGIYDDATIGSDTVLRQLEEIGENSRIKALVLRINSPGGSYTAANEIWYALNKLKADKKIPIVVSQGDYAASGGYFISLPADAIFTEQLSLTGSIGVFGGKPVVKGLMQKLGVSWNEVNFGKNASIMSLNHKFGPAERAIYNKSLDAVYNDFVQKVSEARNIDIKKMDKLARGRVWSGKQAVENGLADEIGGIDEALAKAAELAQLEKYTTVVYPKQKSLQEKFAEFFSNQTNISVNKMMNILGFDSQEIKMLKNLYNNAAVLPIVIKM